MLPSHGKLDCRLCFQDKKSDICTPHPKWKMVNDPGHWGSATPEYLVLGFSKGATQAAAFKTAPHEKVAFAKMRSRLEQALRVLGVIHHSESITKKVENPDSNIAFASLVRCSLTRIDEKASRDLGEERYASSGNLILKSFSEIPTIISRCTETFLTELPDTLKAIFLLGCSDGYVYEVKQIIQSLYPDTYVNLNPMAASADGKLWIFIAHPSPANGTFSQWLSGTGTAGDKARMAQDAFLASDVCFRYDKGHTPFQYGTNSLNSFILETGQNTDLATSANTISTSSALPRKKWSQSKSMGFTPAQAKEMLDRSLIKRGQT
jgi:hypothetical protein